MHCCEVLEPDYCSLRMASDSSSSFRFLEALCTELEFRGLGHWSPQVHTARTLENCDTCHLVRDSEPGLSSVPTILFAKVMDVPALMARFAQTGEKWETSVRSFCNELRFYEGAAANAVRIITGLEVCIAEFARSTLHAWQLQGVRIPTCYASLHDRGTVTTPGAPSAEERFALALELLGEEQHYQLHVFDLAHAEAALRYIARFHAAFWECPASERGLAEPSGSARVKSLLFSPGCWWRKQLRPSIRYDRIANVYEGLVTAFPEVFGGVMNETDASAMQAIADNVDLIAAHCLLDGTRTLVHGDFKTSNLFFVRSPLQSRVTTDKGSGSGRDASEFILDHRQAGAACGNEIPGVTAMGSASGTGRRRTASVEVPVPITRLGVTAPGTGTYTVDASGVTAIDFQCE